MTIPEPFEYFPEKRTSQSFLDEEVTILPPVYFSQRRPDF